MFECKIFFKSIDKCKQILTSKTIKSDTFRVTEKGNLECFCADKKYGTGFYNLVHVKFNGKKYHPYKFKKIFSNMEESK